MLNLQQSSTSALDNNTAIPLMTHLAVLWDSKSRTTLVLLHQQLRVVEITTDCCALIIVTNSRICVILLHLCEIQWQIRFFFGALWRQGWSGINLHFRFHVHAHWLIFSDARRQVIPVLSEVLLCVVQERTEHVWRAPYAYRTHRIRSTFCNHTNRKFIIYSAFLLEKASRKMELAIPF